MTRVVSMSQGRHRAGKSLGKGHCRQANVHTPLHWELHSCLPNQQIVQPQVEPDSSPSREGGAAGPTRALPSPGTCCAQPCALAPSAGVDKPGHGDAGQSRMQWWSKKGWN